MAEKIKKIFAVIGAVITVAVCTFVLVFLRRRDADGLGSDGASERDRRIEEGIGECEERTEQISESLGRAEDSATRCEEHLRRAEEILRNAIKRGEKEKH